MLTAYLFSAMALASSAGLATGPEGHCEQATAATCTAVCPETGEKVEVIRAVNPEHEVIVLDEFKKPLHQGQVSAGGKAKGQPATGNQRASIVVNEDGKVYKLVLEGNDVAAWIDGDEVPKNRIARDGEALILKGKDGNEVYRFRVAESPKGHLFGASTWRAGEDGQFEVMVAPKVMIGVNMSEPDAKLLEHLGFPQGTGIQIDKVIDGTPAQKAGIEAGDIIVTINGVEGATTEGLRKILADREPGDEIKFGVIRKGKRTDLTVKLAKYDSERLGVGAAPGVPAPQDNLFWWNPGEHDEHIAHIEHLNRMLAELRARGDGSVTLQREQLEKLRELADTMRHMQGHGQMRLRIAPEGGSGNFGVFRFPEDESRELYVAPVPPGGGGASGGMAPRLRAVPTPPSAPRAAARPNADAAALNERLDRLEAKLERLEKLLDRLANER